MCGIAGYLSKKSDVNKDVLSKICEVMHHRGPDDYGIWISENQQIGFCHKRLSIIDTSSNGHQPMTSATGRFIIVFNGEIYNHLELRKELNLAGHNISYKSSSDTETLLHCFELWGVEKTAKKTLGMFAFAVYDKEKNVILLVRDRFGEKPLYYGLQDNHFYFASELKSIRANPYFVAEIDNYALQEFIKYSYVPSPYSIYKGIKKLKPGYVLSISLKDVNYTLSEIQYWNFFEVAKNGINKPFQGSDSEAIINLDSKISDAVSSQQLSDVPIGAFLSGGIDSSLIASVMQSQCSTPINTFTIGFNENSFNEAIYAKEVAKHLGTNHNEIYVSPQDAMNIIPDLATMYDEPFADSSQLPTYLLSRMAKQHVTVCLSGDAGDELFGGYNRYIQGVRFKKYPQPLKKAIYAILSQLTPAQFNLVYDKLKPLLPSSFRSSNPGSHIQKIVSILNLTNDWEIYERLTTFSFSSNIIIKGQSHLNNTISNLFNEKLRNIEFANKMMIADSLTYLTDDILCKVDRAAMSVSLETRVPFLDYRLVEFAWRLPLHMKIRNGKGKWILRELLNKYIPPSLIDRPKMGFAIPIDIWLKNELKDWAESLLNEKRIKEDGIFNSNEIKEIWNNHQSGEKGLQSELWNILIFQSWKEQWL
ncbi:MAG: hypothetical protein RL372_428 [Bacteroidota bacterium]|jgi:asparagine synthase (glutamine-hydrolysing)